jgi:CHAT domain-containing protein
MRSVKYILACATFIVAAKMLIAQDKQSLIRSYEDSAKHYEALNQNLRAYNFGKKIFDLMSSMPGTSLEDLGKAESDMGTYAFRMGNISLSETHHRRALKLFQSMATPNYECLYLSGNNMGGIMWFASKIDSAIHYYQIALSALSKMDSTPLNRYYRPAVLNNNLAGIYNLQGKTTKGIAAMKTTIRNLRSYLAINDTSLRRDNAIHFQFEATDNLAGFYKELGDYRQAFDLLMHSYQEKQKNLNPNNPDIHKSEILLGELYYATKEYDNADQFLRKGLAGLETADGDFLYWQADGYGSLSLLYDATDRKDQAERYFEKADSLYNESLQGEFDDIYLEFLRNAALFYAENEKPAIAMAKAMKGYRYIVAAQGANSLPAFYQQLNLGEVNFALGNYRSALDYGRKGVDVVNRIIVSGSSLLDSIKMQLKKPKALLLIAKSEYELLENKNANALNAILGRLQEALNILEKRKSVIQDPNDIRLLMADHSELIEFSKKIIVDLYELSGDAKYVDQLVSLHESGLYNRIRSRLDASDSLRFSHLPLNIQAEERKLKGDLANILGGEGGHDVKMQAYLRAEDQWNRFLEKLRTRYPAYYKMRYGSIFKSLNEIVPDIPSNTSVVRFIFAADRLLALVADKDHRQLIILDSAGLDNDIAALNRNSNDAAKTGDVLFRLYTRLWRPLEKEIRFKKIIIVPDGILFNLNFEILTPQMIERFADFVSNSLLSGFTISYQYSLFLLNAPNTAETLPQSFIAFAPGFSDAVKDQYRRYADTLNEVDHFYLRLLPQPFAIDLAMAANKLFGGDIFMNDNSTVSSFRQHASGHSIIHIGTHALADNLHPEFSRLIFSKDMSNIEFDNYLYLFDIYNCDLSSDLTVLTACESGKAGYKDGEGMISLAHAFNYAGSKSILMGLSRIDEQASARLIDLFYRQLAKGLDKDEAFRQAKLNYLRTANGRMLAPAYWSGLVLMGDTHPVTLEQRNNYGYLVWIGLLAIAGVVFIVARRRMR